AGQWSTAPVNFPPAVYFDRNSLGRFISLDEQEGMEPHTDASEPPQNQQTRPEAQRRFKIGL
ncbi:MAG: hypothetical protein AAGN35_27670, partial [Bacteroidota bacterium]